jgi:hypothetical protein
MNKCRLDLLPAAPLAVGEKMLFRRKLRVFLRWLTNPLTSDQINLSPQGFLLSSSLPCTPSCFEYLRSRNLVLKMLTRSLGRVARSAARISQKRSLASTAAGLVCKFIKPYSSWLPR